MENLITVTYNKELFIVGEDFNKCTSSTVVNNNGRLLLKNEPKYRW